MAKNMLHVMQLRDLLGAGHPSVKAALAEARSRLGLDAPASAARFIKGIPLSKSNYQSPVIQLSPANDHRMVCRLRNGTVLRGAAARRHLEEGLKKRGG